MRFFSHLLVVVMLAMVFTSKPTHSKPQTIDILLGRGSMLTANSTCGLKGDEEYCVYSSHTDDCGFICNSARPYNSTRETRSHLIENVVQLRGGQAVVDRNRWWQSIPDEPHVAVTLDVGYEMLLFNVFVSFRHYAPDAYSFWRSRTKGVALTAMEYYASSCKKSYPGVRHGVNKKDVDVRKGVPQCYPLKTAATTSAGQILFEPIRNNFRWNSLTSSERRQYETYSVFRTLQLQLDQYNHAVYPKHSKYRYYAIDEMTIDGDCFCNGHGHGCLPEKNVLIKVGSKCQCNNLTTGINCQSCQTFYNDIPWTDGYDQTNQETCRACECNGKSRNCTFENSAWVASNYTSGGRCLGCTQNTKGTRCQRCADGFYQNATSIDQPWPCARCNCLKAGTVGNVGCVKGKGSCTCKKNVERLSTGQFCDTCKEGFFNLTDTNDDGCSPCNCNKEGSHARSCNVSSGECFCKNNVIGNKCDKCLPGHYGIQVDGCYPCKCNYAGARSFACNTKTGKCECNPGFMGRDCGGMTPNSFLKTNTTIIEAEEGGKGINLINVPVDPSDPNGLSKEASNNGFAVVNTTGRITFEINGTDHPGYHSVYLRVNSRGGYQIIPAVKLISGRVATRNPICDGGRASPDISKLSPTGINEFKRVRLFARVCFEPGTMNELAVVLIVPRDEPKEMNIDGLVLVRYPDSVTENRTRISDKDIRKSCEFRNKTTGKTSLDNRCLDVITKLSRGTILPIDCACDATGAYNNSCQRLGGQCPCKPNVEGRTCNRCKDNHYGFGRTGCQACNCNSKGTVDGQLECHPTSGQCQCTPNGRGRTCGECGKGRWNFPACEACQCNGRAKECNIKTGVCIDCTDNTQGKHCERCRAHWHGKPEACRACRCPGRHNVTGERYHASGCVPTSKMQFCFCNKGHVGRNCDSCTPNHYRNVATNMVCKPCRCNNNINQAVAQSCDGGTGRCTKCVANTVGDACEHCAAGYHGNALNRTCKRCVCLPHGTLGQPVAQTKLFACNRTTGVCPCRPNVKPPHCFGCQPNHFNITNPDGCMACACHKSGSVKQQCSQMGGVCTCKRNYGGVKCDRCRDGYFGDPDDPARGCQPCNCVREGTRNNSGVCDPRSGACPCISSVVGRRCDKCARGTKHRNSSDVSKCERCGDCWDDADRIIQELIKKVNGLVKQAKNISISGDGAVSSTDKFFKEMSRRLAEIEERVQPTNKTVNRFGVLKRKLEKATQLLQKFADDARLKENHKRAKSKNTALGDSESATRDKLDSLSKQIAAFKQNVSRLQEQIPAGALDSIKDSVKKSNASRAIIENVHANVTNEKRPERTRLEIQFGEFKQKRQATMQINSDRIQSIKDTAQLQSSIIRGKLNPLICGGSRGKPGTRCDSLCGGGGCSTCGGEARGSSCSNSMAARLAKVSGRCETIRGRVASRNNAMDTQENEVARVNAVAGTATAVANRAAVCAANADGVLNATLARITELVDNVTGALAAPIRTRADFEKVVGQIKAVRLTDDAYTKLADLSREITENLVNEEEIQKIEDATRTNSRKTQTLLGEAQRLREEASGNISAAKSMEEVRSRIENDYNDVEKNVKQYDNTNIELEQSRKKLNDGIEKATPVIENLKTDTDALKKKQGKMSVQSVQLGEQLQHMKTREDSLVKTLKGFKDKLKQLNKKRDEIEVANATMATLVQQIDDTSNQIKERLERIQKKIDDFEFFFKKHEDAINVHHSNINDLEGKLPAMVHEAREKSTDIYIGVTKLSSCDISESERSAFAGRMLKSKFTPWDFPNEAAYYN